MEPDEVRLAVFITVVAACGGALMWLYMHGRKPKRGFRAGVRFKAGVRLYG